VADPRAAFLIKHRQLALDVDNLTGSVRGLGPGAEIDGVAGDGAALMSDEQPSVPRRRAEGWITQSPHQPPEVGRRDGTS
jgi:hypothetical protein